MSLICCFAALMQNAKIKIAMQWFRFSDHADDHLKDLRDQQEQREDGQILVVIEVMKVGNFPLFFLW